MSGSWVWGQVKILTGCLGQNFFEVIGMNRFWGIIWKEGFDFSEMDLVESQLDTNIHIYKYFKTVIDAMNLFSVLKQRVREVN